MSKQDSAMDLYLKERELLSADDVQAILDAGRRWSLSSLLASNGSAIFPHTYLSQCGDQVAAVVHGCLDSGADQVLVLGVLHPLSEELVIAREKELNGEPLMQEGSHGVLGPGIGGENYWRHEFSLLNFQFLWDEEVKRRGISAPRLILRFPSLVAGSPGSLRGIEDLAAQAKDSVVVATGDLCHHGVAYGANPDEVFDFGSRGEQYARQLIEESLALLYQGDYPGYFKHCRQHLNDSMDTGAVLRHLLGPLQSSILDLRLVDVSPLFDGEPKPSWVAAALVAMEAAQA